MQGTSFTFTFFRFTGDTGSRRTELVRDYNLADGMRGMVDRKPDQIHEANQKVLDWASGKGITVHTQEPYPSEKYPGKVWLEYRFGGLSL